MTTRTAPVLAEWQRMTRDPADTHASDRCAAHSPVREPRIGRPFGICLRRMAHVEDWHEGRTVDGTFVSWPAGDIA